MTDQFQGTNNADIQAGNLPSSENPLDSQRKVRKFFNNFYQGQLSYPSLLKFFVLRTMLPAFKIVLKPTLPLVMSPNTSLAPAAIPP